MQFRCPNCRNPIVIEEHDESVGASQATLDAITCPSCNSKFSLSAEETTTYIPEKGMSIGHFDVRQVLGEGAFGTVYKCLDTELNRFVAVKVPREGRVSQDSAALFMREARAAAAINHPNVISVYEVGQYGDGFYIASEFIDGIALSEVLKLRTFPPREAGQLMIKLLRAVQVFHDKGIVHRDLKSGNILIDTSYEPHIADFGLARRENPQEITVTQTGKIIGTPAYMSPEQARGDVKGTTATSDQYSLGVIFYELLTNDRPFRATNSRTLLHSILTDEVRSPRSVNASVPKDLDTICCKALEKDPACRYDSVGEMADDIQRYLDGHTITARPAGIGLKARRWCERNPWVAALSVVIGILAVATAALLSREPEVLPPVIRIEAPPVKTHNVRMAFTMSGGQIPGRPVAKWTVVPLEPKAAQPIESEIVRFESDGDLTMPLKPGRYLFVVSISDFGFHEVFRRVPEDPTELSQVYSVEKWSMNAEGEVVLPPVNIWQRELITSGMVKVSGGEFSMGADIEVVSPVHRRRVDDFYIDPAEVTLRDFRATRISSTEFTEDQARMPMTGISWLTAASYAEAIGKRLPLEAEFEFVATNGGTTEYPWGDNPDLIPPTGVISVETNTIDICRNWPIRGLCSNASEWTWDTPAPYPGTQTKAPAIHRLMHESRVIRGAAPEDAPREMAIRVSRFRRRLDAEMSDPKVGFRCCVSDKPLFE
ncbi:MAG: protein kinase [Planctomycetaceae bacterium]|nr:protein kinase [Planctomycetaceae bacterium]